MNQKCNALQVLVGLFLHSCNAPEVVVTTLSHMGVSVSAQTINNTVKSLSPDASKELQKVAHTMLASFAFDNLDMNFAQGTATLETSHPTLTHVTTATVITLQNVTQEDLSCALELWERSPMNPNRSVSIPPVSDNQLEKIHPEPPLIDNLTRRQRFNAWKFLHDLVHHGPTYFKQHSQRLGHPETVDQVPVVKMRQVHARIIDTPCSTPKENGGVMEDLLEKQARLGGETQDPETQKISPKFKSLLNFVILVFGDLGVGNHLQSYLASRRIEKTPWRRMQFLVYVLGLFHVKMACADALWKIFIKPVNAGKDTDFSVLKCLRMLRHKQINKIQKKPGFRQMHEVIMHVGIVSRLDCWRAVTGKSLDALAESAPSWEDLCKIANSLAREYVASGGIERKRMERPSDRDQVKENHDLRNAHFLLYEELSYSINQGDIGRLETTFMPWAYIFRATGKHKYAKALRKYLHDVHFLYPKGLKYFIASFCSSQCIDSFTGKLYGAHQETLFWSGSWLWARDSSRGSVTQGIDPEQFRASEARAESSGSSGRPPELAP